MPEVVCRIEQGGRFVELERKGEGFAYRTEFTLAVGVVNGGEAEYHEVTVLADDLRELLLAARDNMEWGGIDE